MTLDKDGSSHTAAPHSQAKSAPDATLNDDCRMHATTLQPQAKAPGTNGDAGQGFGDHSFPIGNASTNARGTLQDADGVSTRGTLKEEAASTALDANS